MRLLDEKMRSYSPGNLVAALEITEYAEEFLKQKGIPEELRGLVSDMKSVMEQIITSGSDADLEKRFSGLAETLAAYTNRAMPQAEKVEKTENRIIIEDLEVLLSFIQESQDHLENIEEKILKMESTEDPDLVNAIFRSMHTIKGISSFIGLDKIKNVSHALESLLDELREHNLEISSELVDILLEGTDLVRTMVQHLAEASTELEKTDKGFVFYEPDIEITAPVEKINKIMSKEKKTSEAQKKPSSAAEMAMPEELITQEMVDKFVEESTDLLESIESTLLEVEKDPKNTELVDEAFRAVHTIKGNAGFFWYTSIERQCMDIETILDSFRTGKQVLNNQIVTALLDAVDVIKHVLAKVQAGEVKPGPGTEAAHAGGDGDSYEDKPLGEVLVEMGLASRDDVEQALDLQQMKLGELLVEEGKIEKEALNEALQKQGRAKQEAQDQFSAYKIKRKDIRVDTGRLDTLFNLMGELITAEAMLIGNSQLKEMHIEGFDKAVTYLSKITRELQEITMSVRMIPLDGLFNKMRRLVRDLSRKFSKTVNLHISGEDTEMDRNVMEEISDPLVHIIRNAIDHGLEDSSARKAAGKNAMGTIHLGARYEGNEIWISVADDGKGLNREKIVKKAVDRGKTREELEALPDSDIWALIFEPGFSTAEQVSEISGRGVGMDVVKRNLEKLRGKIDVISTEGLGTEFIMKIPLTLAIIDGVTVTVGDMLYSIPITDIRTFYKAEDTQVTRPEKGVEVLRLRDDLFPVIKLGSFFQIPDAVTSFDQGTVLVVQGGGKVAAVLVDGILGYNQLVIKPLPGYMSKARGISGCSIMGDGDLSLIIDTGSLLSSVLE
ncbi:MAG: chemotaxis protein CheA [Spirochaetales bacterium]|nr:chemotaxis protein CheA [Spirochaetales bacterium]